MAAPAQSDDAISGFMDDADARGSPSFDGVRCAATPPRFATAGHATRRRKADYRAARRRAPISSSCQSRMREAARQPSPSQGKERDGPPRSAAERQRRGRRRRRALARAPRYAVAGDKCHDTEKMPADFSATSRRLPAYFPQQSSRRRMHGLARFSAQWPPGSVIIISHHRPLLRRREPFSALITPRMPDSMPRLPEMTARDKLCRY